MSGAQQALISSVDQDRGKPGRIVLDGTLQRVPKSLDIRICGQGGQDGLQGQRAPPGADALAV
jgi:hypothetical protein